MSNEDYEAIADRLVKKQLLRQLDPQRWPGLYHVEGRADDPLTAGVACHDWRVAGACMERMGPGLLAIMLEDYIHPSDCKESFPIAIILAYLESSESENERGDFDDRPRHYP